MLADPSLRHLAQDTTSNHADMADFPLRVAGEMAWVPAELESETLFTIELDESHVEELERAMDTFKDLGLDGDLICRDNFPLPTIQYLLADISAELHDGKGFSVLRGLDPSRYTAEDNMLLFLGISSYVGNRRGRQGQGGEMITHVIDPLHSTLPQQKRRLVHSHLAIQFHSDILCDILATQTLSCAAEGGSSYISPAWTIYNAIKAQNPDIIDTLARPDWPVFDAARNPPYQLRPVLFHCQGRIVISLSELHVKMDAPFRRTHKIPSLSEAQNEALNAVLTTARKFQLRMDSRPGDLRFVNNLSILHARQAYRDDSLSNRHLVRLYLRNDEYGWDIPPALQSTWDSVYAADPSVDEVYPIVPMPINLAPLYRFGN